MRRTIQGRGFRGEVRLDAGEIGVRAEAARDRALAQVGEYIRARSAAIAPLRSGAMVGSAQVGSAAGKVTVRYGTVYAAVQHEHADFNHPNGGQAGFLQSVIEDSATADMAERIFGAELRKCL